MAEHPAGCPDPGDRPPLSRDAALERILARARPLAGTQTIPLDEGLGRVLAVPIASTVDVPGWDNSAMDGYAIRTADLEPAAGLLRVAQRIPAGTAGLTLEPGTAARIFTGAPVPTGADTVVIQEHCKRDGDWVQIPAGTQAGGNIRRAGEDLRAGVEAIPAGTRLGPQHLGLAASGGAAQLTVYRRLRVAVLASGDELIAPGKPLAPGQIYDSNRFALNGLLRGLGCEVLDLGLVPDTLEATVDAFAQAAACADLVLTSGGVSVGEEDHVKAAIERLGSLDLWSVAVRPGKPLAFGQVGATFFLGCPGNPVSLFVTFCLFARPLVLRLQGVAGDLAPRSFSVRAGFDWLRPDRRREFHRARLATGPNGEPEAIVYPSRSAGVLSSVVWADGLVEIPEGQAVRRGEPVIFIPFEGLFH